MRCLKRRKLDATQGDCDHRCYCGHWCCKIPARPSFCRAQSLTFSGQAVFSGFGSGRGLVECGWRMDAPCTSAPFSSSESFLPSLLDALELEAACFWKVLLVLALQELEEGQLRCVAVLWWLTVGMSRTRIHRCTSSVAARQCDSSSLPVFLSVSQLDASFV